MKSWFVRLMIASTAAFAEHAAVAAVPPLKPSRPPAVRPAPAPTPAVPVSAIAQYLNIDISAPANYAAAVLPAHYDQQVLRSANTPADNRITDRGATLGRVLFWDKRLSVNNTVACATCHQPANGFSAATQFSKGFSGAAGTAHTMGLANIAFYRAGSMFWDKRATSLEAQATQPITNPIEMGFDASNGGINALLVKMQALPYYPELFQAVYGDAAITESRIQLALAQFQRSMVSANSRWDRGYASTYNPALADKGLSLDVPGLTAQENTGRRLFMGAPNNGGIGCAGCHQPPTFALSPNSRSNGLDAGETRVFKSPSLKSLSPGQPMMHDGRFTTFEQVVSFYNLDVKNGPALDNRLKTPRGDPRVPNLSRADQAALVAFLKTLDDPTLRIDTRFGNPFKQ